MTYTVTIDIARSRPWLARLFDNPEYWPHWQDSLVRAATEGGTPREAGAQTRLTHQFGRRRVDMIETIESKRLPDEMTCRYEAPGAWNRVTYRFTERGPRLTR